VDLVASGVRIASRPAQERGEQARERGSSFLSSVGRPRLSLTVSRLSVSVRGVHLYIGDPFWDALKEWACRISSCPKRLVVDATRYRDHRLRACFVIRIPRPFRCLNASIDKGPRSGRPEGGSNLNDRAGSVLDASQETAYLHVTGYHRNRSSRPDWLRKRVCFGTDGVPHRWGFAIEARVALRAGFALEGGFDIAAVSRPQLRPCRAISRVIDPRSASAAIASTYVRAACARRRVGTHAKRKAARRRLFHPRIRGGTFHPRIRGGTFHPRIRGGTFHPRIRGGTLHPRIRGGTLHPRIRGGTLHPRIRGGTLHPRIRGGTFHPRVCGGTARAAACEADSIAIDACANIGVTSDCAPHFGTSPHEWGNCATGLIVVTCVEHVCRFSSTRAIVFDRGLLLACKRHAELS
jgi:hypothetical protein